MLRAFVQYTLNVDLNAPVIKDLVEKYKDIEQFNRSITDKYVAICKRFYTFEFSRLCRMKVCKQTDPEKGLTPVNRNVKDLRMAR